VSRHEIEAKPLHLPLSQRKLMSQSEPASASRQLPSSMVCQEFGEINVRRVGSDLEVSFTVLMEPQGSAAEGWQTGVALDASASMKACYGRGVDGKIPPEVQADYARRGWVEEKTVDGRRVATFHAEARRDARAKGYIRAAPNQMEPLAREFIAYLAGNLDADGGATVIYWACGDGSAYEVIGDFTAEQCAALTLGGPPASRLRRWHLPDAGRAVFRRSLPGRPPGDVCLSHGRPPG
jgi:hypothetical protein